MSSIEMNIDDWNIDDIEELIEVNQNSTYEEIISASKQLINRARAQGNDEYVNFIANAAEKLINNYSNENDSDYNREDDEEINDTNSSNIQDRIVETMPYQGSIPKPIPNDYAFTNYNNNYVGGLVNPIKRETLTTTLILNSKFRDFYMKNKNNNKRNCIKEAFGKYNVKDLLRQKGTSTDFVIELEEPFSNVISMRLSGLELVNGYYSISEYLGTNVFSITTLDVNGDIAVENIIKIPDGVYTVDFLKKHIQSQFNEYIIKMSIEYYELSQKIYFQMDGNYSSTYIINFNNPYIAERNLYYNLGWILGFRKSTYTFANDAILFKPDSNNTTNNSNGIYGETSINLIGTSFFLLCVDDFNNNSSNVVSYNPGTKYSHNIRNVLATIPNAVQTHEILFEDSSDRINKTRTYFGPVSIKKLHIKILDEYGRHINNTQDDLSIKLEIETLNSPHKNIII